MVLEDQYENLDFFFVLKGAVEFTMREDFIHRVKKDDAGSGHSLSTDSQLVNNDSEEELKKPSYSGLDANRLSSSRLSKRSL